jgi:hypothetical protein
MRIKNGITRNGSFWCVHHIGTGNTVNVRWYEFDMNGWPISGENPELANSGTFDFGEGQFSWMADIGVSADGSAVIAYSRSSSTDFAAVYRSVKPSQSSSFGASTSMVEGEGTDSSGRWGDYAGVDEDPAAPGTFWTHNEYAGPGANNWRTWVGQVEAGSGMVLTVDQLVKNQITTLHVAGAQPGATVYFAYSIKGAGATFVPFLEITLDIRKPKLLASKTSDVVGTAIHLFRVPNSAPLGLDVLFQAAAFQAKSNVVDEVVTN